MQLYDFEESDGVTSEGKDIFLFALEKSSAHQGSSAKVLCI